MTRFLAVAAFLLFVPAAHAGTAVESGGTITYSGGSAGESVEVGIEEGKAYVYSSAGVSGNCEQVDAGRVHCNVAGGFLVNTLDGADTISGGTNMGSMTLEIHSGAGGDTLFGGANADRIYGEAGDDFLQDGAGDDAISGGPGNDHLRQGAGRDAYTGGDGTDTVDYSDRTAPVTITLAGGADDGESGEADDVGTEVENASGGSGADRIVGNPAGNTIGGGAGNDSITGGSSEDRIEGGAGDDTIDSRDGKYDSIDCGEGNDTVFGDPGDSTTNCEVAPDADGDGFNADRDCAPLDPKINPGAGEVAGNPVDENCDGVALYLRVINPVNYLSRKVGKGVRFTSFKIAEVTADQTVEVRCKGGKKKGCAFTTKTYTGRTGALSILSIFKKKALKKGASVELRVLRPNEIGKVVRLKVSSRIKLTQTVLCLPVGETVPKACA